MFHKKKFKLVEKKSDKISAKNRWIRYFIILGLVGFVLLIILANVKSKSYYQSLKVPKVEYRAQTNSSAVFLNDTSVQELQYSCSNYACSVSCAGDMSDLKGYLNKQKTCNSMTLSISNYFFPNDRLESNWVVGSFNLTIIRIKGLGTLKGIDDGAFDHKTVKYVTELELSNVQIQSLTKNTFNGLSSLKKFTLSSKVEKFVGDSFLKPMEKTLEYIQLKIDTPYASDPAPWLRGNFMKLISIVLDGSNLGNSITNDTFQHLSTIAILKMDACKISALPNGVFNFMMTQDVVYISLQSNQLQKLSGNYLKGISSIKRMNLAYNLWNCTCELNELIQEYQRYPDGFGYDVMCSTPVEYADQCIGDINIGSCDDTTTTVTTTTTITTTPTEESPSTSANITDPAPTTINTDPPPYTTIITETSVLWNISSEISSTEWSEQDSSSSTDGSDQNSSSSTEVSSEDAEDSTSETSADSTDIVTLPQTTPSPQNRTTTLSANTIFIECQRYKSSSTVDVIIEISPPLTSFSITYLSATSVKLIVEDPIKDLALIWFYDQPHLNGTGKDIRIVGEFKVGCQSDVENTLTIEGLSENRAYTFCLVQEGQQVISPFSCIPYCTGTDMRSDTDTWLRLEDKALTIGLFIFGILVSLILGSLATFFTIRSYPVLLKGSKRVIVVNRCTGDVLIMPKPSGKQSLNGSSFRNSYETNTTMPQKRLSEASIQSGLSYMLANNYEDIEYHWKMNIVEDMIYANRIPKNPPPPLPKRLSQSANPNKEDCDKINISVIHRKENDYGYIP